MGSRAQSSQTQSQTTTQTDNRVGASDNAIVGQGNARIGSTETKLSAGGNLSIQSIDPDTIAGAFGLSDTVVNRLADLAGQSTQGAQNLAERLSSQTTGAIERIGSGFGQQITDLATAKSGGISQNLMILIALAIGAALFLFRRK